MKKKTQLPSELTVLGQLGRRDARGRKAIPPRLAEGDRSFSVEHLERIELELMAIQRKTLELATEIELASMGGATPETDEFLAEMIVSEHVQWTGWQTLVHLKKKMLQGIDTTRASLKGTIRQLKDVLGRSLLARKEDPERYKATVEVVAAREHLREFCRLVPLLGFTHDEMELGSYAEGYRKARLKLNRAARAAREEAEDKAFDQERAVKVRRPRGAGRAPASARRAIKVVQDALNLPPPPAKPRELVTADVST